MSLREEQCRKVCRILDDVLANRPTERDSLIVAVRKAFEAEPQWIPVTENYDCDLMDNEEVLVCQKDGQIRHAMFYDYGDKKTFVTWEEGITIYNVLAYMPLPEPNKGVME